MGIINWLLDVTLALWNDWLAAFSPRERPSGAPPAGNLWGAAGRGPAAGEGPAVAAALSILKGTAPPTGHAGMLRRSGDSPATPQQFLGS